MLTILVKLTKLIIWLSFMIRKNNYAADFYLIIIKTNLVSDCCNLLLNTRSNIFLILAITWSSCFFFLMLKWIYVTGDYKTQDFFIFSFPILKYNKIYLIVSGNFYILKITFNFFQNWFLFQSIPFQATSHIFSQKIPEISVLETTSIF